MFIRACGCSRYCLRKTPDGQINHPTAIKVVSIVDVGPFCSIARRINTSSNDQVQAGGRAVHSGTWSKRCGGFFFWSVGHTFTHLYTPFDVWTHVFLTQALQFTTKSCLVSLFMRYCALRINETCTETSVLLCFERCPPSRHSIPNRCVSFCGLLSFAHSCVTSGHGR